MGALQPPTEVKETDVANGNDTDTFLPLDATASDVFLRETVPFFKDHSPNNIKPGDLVSVVWPYGAQTGD